jgi:hypothetical protein
MTRRELSLSLIGALGLFAISPVWATTVLQPGPIWWSPVDGLTRTQYHSFLTDPNENLPPDYTNNGFQPSTADQWTVAVAATGAYDTDIPDDNPFIDSQGNPYGDGRGVEIDPNGLIRKVMGNFAVPTNVKYFFVQLIWQGAADLVITADAVGAVLSSQSQVDDSGWHSTWLTGSITPQPDQEVFTFSFSNASSPIYMDSVWVGTHCVPAPATALLLGSGGLILFGRRCKGKRGRYRMARE